MTIRPEQVLAAEFSRLARAQSTVTEGLASVFATWDPGLTRPPRVLVPIDVQALVILAGDSAPVGQVLRPPPDPGPVGQPAPDPATVAPVAPFTDGGPRAPGAYVHWAAPDGLTQAAERRPGDPAPVGGDSGFHPLPDRWLVVRVAGAAVPRRTRSWIVESERGRAVDLRGWTETASALDLDGSATPHLTPEKLTSTAGGDPAWAAVFDACENRFGIHDPLDDLTEADRAATISYLVCGWWSDDANDPLNTGTLAERISRVAKVRWDIPPVAADVEADRALAARRGAQIGLASRSIAEMVSVDPGGTNATTHMASNPHELMAAVAETVVGGGTPALPRLSLVHGGVIGVLPRPVSAIDDRPSADSVEVAVGSSGTEAFAALIAEDRPADEREADERLVAAFAAGLIARLDAPDGLVAVDEELHAAEFVSQPGGTATTDRVVQGDRVAAARAKSDAAVAGASSAFAAAGREAVLATEHRAHLLVERDPHATIESLGQKLARPVAAAALTPRSLTVAAPAWHFPADPVVTIRSVNRSLRHGYDGRASTDNTLACRVSGSIRTGFAGLVDGGEVVAPLGSGSVPPECDELLRELVLDDPTTIAPVAAHAAAARSLPAEAVTVRLHAEHALLWDVAASGAGKDLLRAVSLRAGVEASPIARTSWRQPWVPLFLEWQLALDIDDSLDRWTLAEIDLDVGGDASAAPALAPPAPQRTATGRVLLTSMAARAFAAKVADFVNEETQRGPAMAVLRSDEEAELSSIAQAGALFDVLSGGLQGLREELLGLDWADAGRVAVDGSGTRTPPAPVAAPLLLRGGLARFTRMRIVDAFGRTLEISPARLDAAAVASRMRPSPVDLTPPAAAGDVTPPPAEANRGAAGQGGAVTASSPPPPLLPRPQLLLRPRLNRPARIELDFVDPAAPDGAAAALATVDQVDPTRAVNPICGWLLPDHLDGALEVFDGAAEPLGMLLEDIEGRVAWEGAPGLPGPIGAPPAPLRADDSAARHVVRFAAAVVSADARQRDAAAATGGAATGGGGTAEVVESALSALLRTIDTTLWTIDPFGTIGTEHVSGLVGRPVAVVRMTVRLSVLDDLGSGPDAELTLDGAALASRRAAYAALGAKRITIRLGELTRTDDGVLGYFVDDDYTRFTPVSPEVLAAARTAGRHTGQLSEAGVASVTDPASAPIVHPFVDDSEQPLVARPGQLVRLTVLMAPGGAVHATTGILPRAAVYLARDWIADALHRLSPAFRIGPTLVDSTTVRLPTISALPKAQVFTARTDPTDWRDDPIAAATQDALLPDAQAVLREGYVRVAAPPATGPS